MEKVKFNYSESEMVAYLLTKGYNYTDVFVKSNDRYKGKVKVFFTFEGYKNELIEIANEFNNGISSIRLKEYINNLICVKRVISNEIRKISQEQRRE